MHFEPRMFRRLGSFNLYQVENETDSHAKKQANCLKL